MDGIVGKFSWGACLECKHSYYQRGGLTEDRINDCICHYQDSYAIEVLLSISYVDDDIVCRYFEKGD